MVEGFCADSDYPSTMVRMVPLPFAFAMGRI
jgi:hypothetical protein